ncbi:aldehyde dehydrogenase [Rhizodiscina lignyota]|uniref:aldehyde dehydrogenase (NAD(+)) n=1 Tax=Rhizodiscina lignyota TaxID=1504668 RepID=A0A9P4I597_9PEZI|nr:aldehyde dehydrogenase [Rhizodiscina lignyota]
MAPESRHWINNEFVESDAKETITLHSPYDESVVGTVPVADEQVVDSAVAAARKAFETGPWPTFTAAQRAQCLLKFADLIQTKADEIAQIEAESIGQPVAFAKMIVGACVATYRYYAGWTDKVAGESYKEEDGTYRIVQYEPFGVCAGIAAWNATALYLGWKMAPALAAGNTFVFKSSEKAPFTPLIVAELYKEAGFPPGVVNFVSGGGSTGQLLSAHMDIDKISFTGSGITGRKVQDAAAKSNLKKVTLELGGKSPAVVFEDANIENAISQNSQMFLMNTSQVCAATSRVFVQKSIADKFIEALKGAFKGAEGAFQNPKEPTTMLGPLADKLQYDRVMSFIQSGKSESGAELLVGGDKIEGQKGFFVQPTIFLNPKEDAKIYREEIFGPVLNIKTFETEEEAIKLANDTAYGLASAVYTASVSRALRVASKIRAGTVGVNAVAFPSAITPFGGYKQSGYGRELGKAGIMAYLQEKTISINMAV